MADWPLLTSKGTIHASSFNGRKEACKKFRCFSLFTLLHSALVNTDKGCKIKKIVEWFALHSLEWIWDVLFVFKIKINRPNINIHKF